MSLKDTADDVSNELDSIADDLNALQRKLDREVKESSGDETEDSKTATTSAANKISDATAALRLAIINLEDVEEPEEDPDEDSDTDPEEDGDED